MGAGAGGGGGGRLEEEEEVGGGAEGGVGDDEGVFWFFGLVVGSEERSSAILPGICMLLECGVLFVFRGRFFFGGLHACMRGMLYVRSSVPLCCVFGGLSLRF